MEKLEPAKIKKLRDVMALGANIVIKLQDETRFILSGIFTGESPAIFGLTPDPLDRNNDTSVYGILYEDGGIAFSRGTKESLCRILDNITLYPK